MDRVRGESGGITHLANLARDPNLHELVEVDFTQYYSYRLDLSQLLHGPGSEIGWVARHLANLPRESRYVQWYAEDWKKYDINQHLTQDIIDLLELNLYYTQVGASSGFQKESVWAKVQKEAPKRRERPGEPKQKKPMSTKAERAAFFGGAGGKRQK